MKTPVWQDQILATVDGFKMVLSFESEDHIDPRNHFINECEWTPEQYLEVKNFYWFTAKITAFKGSIACGSAYLGANCYKNLKGVMSHGGNGEISCVLGGYAPQMIDEALEDAKRNLNK